MNGRTTLDRLMEQFRALQNDRTPEEMTEHAKAIEELYWEWVTKMKKHGILDDKTLSRVDKFVMPTLMSMGQMIDKILGVMVETMSDLRIRIQEEMEHVPEEEV